MSRTNMAGEELLELDSLEVLVIIDNELDPISPSPNQAVIQTGGMRTIATNGPDISKDSTRSGAARELRMDHVCCSAHGLSLMITGIKGEQRHTVLFDTGPEEHAWERNARRTGADIGAIETIQLSHWHRDHSGGMLKVLSMIQAAAPDRREPVHVDLHPARPTYRGMQPPGGPVVSLEPDPTFDEIEKAGGLVRKHDRPHTIGGDMFLVSGEIPRVTSYERGLKFGMRFNESIGAWEQDEEMADERFLMAKLKGKGLVMFTGCSHAGVVNAAKHARDLCPSTPLYAVMGGFHLAEAEPALISQTVRDLEALNIEILLAGHCTGWRAKFEIQSIMGEGSLVPSFVGSRFVL